ncbi:hypothetical protein [Mycolicibacterium elephantis]|uniref:hypothetical protein n=1 Tax=Mycolicibacterium elephantis TaxID=81858 RepID=UPI0013E37AFF|nr:hypothetical protein [Mycolicibacterium elephantis]MCV7220994.1 hypothetical protein [Mycolicibacterium elephantis]
MFDPAGRGTPPGQSAFELLSLPPLVELEPPPVEPEPSLAELESLLSLEPPPWS